MKKQFVFLIFSIALNMHACFVYAAAQTDSVGNVISIQGQARIIDQSNNSRELQRRSEIYLNDKVVTQENGKVQLRLRDDSMIVVQPSSEYFISEFVYKKGSPRDSKYVGNIVKGALINISGQGKGGYQLRSPLTTIAVRGTGFATKLITKDDDLVNQEVFVFDGHVSVINRCENIPGCIPSSVNIGAGQASNAAIINSLGKINGFKSSGMMGTVGNVVLGRSDSGSVTIKCK